MEKLCILNSYYDFRITMNSNLERLSSTLSEDIKETMKLKADNKVESLLKSEDWKTSQGFVDVKKKTIAELNELVERQNKLLKNRSFLEKLPDKGSKILSFKAELELEIKHRQKQFEAECDKACQVLSNLRLSNTNADEIEWQQNNSSEKQLDSDDEDEQEQEEISPLKIIATHSGTASGKTVKLNSSEMKPFAKDLNSVKKLSYVEKFCEKYEKPNNCKERFKPNQLKNNDKTLFLSSTENIKKRLGSKWEVTQATPPVPIYKDTVMITLAESLKLQKEQAEKLKEIEKRHAAEKLMQNMSVKMGDKLPVNNITEYRGSKNPFEESAGEEDEDDDSNSDGEIKITTENTELES